MALPSLSLKGEFTRYRRGKSRSRVTKEQIIMRQALALDFHRCRYPRCVYRGLVVDPAHLHGQHRGMGGNPKGDKTRLETVFALCRQHHEEYDHERGFTVVPIQPRLGTRGLMTFTRERDGVRVLIGVN